MGLEHGVVYTYTYRSIRQLGDCIGFFNGYVVFIEKDLYTDYSASSE